MPGEYSVSTEMALAQELAVSVLSQSKHLFPTRKKKEITTVTKEEPFKEEKFTVVDVDNLARLRIQQNIVKMPISEANNVANH
jgi:hypothetical protein